MEDYMKERPRKAILSKIEQNKILKQVRDFVLKDLLPDKRINKILLFGSLAKGAFGRYESAYKSRTYSDIDILLFVDDEFKIPKKWKSHFECKLYDVYNVRKLKNKILIQYMVCRKRSYQNKGHQKEAEKWGVPLLLSKSRHKYIVLYKK